MLNENNKALNLRVDTLNNIIKDKDNKISYLNSKIIDLKSALEYFKNKFDTLISFLHRKLHSWYDKDNKYIDAVNEMYEGNILDDEDIKNLDLSKEKDDFEKKFKSILLSYHLNYKSSYFLNLEFAIALFFNKSIFSFLILSIQVFNLEPKGVNSTPSLSNPKIILIIIPCFV